MYSCTTRYTYWDERKKKYDERLGKDAVLVYTQENYGIFDLDDYTARVAGLQETPRQRLIKIMEAQKEARLKREG